MDKEFDNGGISPPYARCLCCGTEGVYVFDDGRCEDCSREGDEVVNREILLHNDEDYGV